MDDGAACLVAFVREREAVRRRRAAGEPPPWTDDPVLRKYRFCCVRREDDAVTTWLRTHWREPLATHPDLWFAMVVARHVNNIPALAEMPLPLPWDPVAHLAWADARRARGATLFGQAYMISTNGKPADDKVRYLVDMVFNPTWAQREGLRPRAGDTLTSYHVLLGQLYGLASFLAGQVIADLKYAEPLRSAPDWATFACSGPGSRKGLNVALGRRHDAHWQEDDWRLALARLREQVTPALEEAGIVDLDAQNLQNCLCEFFKHSKVRLGLGAPKQLYRGGGA